MKNPFPGARINDDEIAVTDLLAHMKQYVETGKEFYPLREGLQDAYLSFLMDEAVKILERNYIDKPKLVCLKSYKTSKKY